MSIRDLEIAVRIGKQIIDKLPQAEELKGTYLQRYKEYTKMITQDKEFILKEWNDDKNMQTCALDELETEDLHAECVFRWLQENKISLS